MKSALFEKHENAISGDFLEDTLYENFFFKQAAKCIEQDLTP